MATDESLDLTSEYGVNEDADETEQESAADWDTAEEDESADDLLELGDAQMADEEEPEAGMAEAEAPVDVTPVPDRAAPRISTGGTLFERMSNLSRGLSRSDEAEDDKDDGANGGLNIPRFLDRQSNN